MKIQKRYQRYGILSCLLFALLCPLISGAAVKAAEKTIVEYYYYNSCDGCTEGEYFENELKDRVSDVIGDGEYNFLLKDVSKETYYQEFLEITADQKTEEFDPQPPLLKVGDVFLFGLDEITERSRDVMIQEVKGRDSDPEALAGSMKGIDPEDTFFVYFYMPGCGDCQKAEKYLEALDKKIYLENQKESNLKIVYVNIGELDHVPLANWFYENYQVPEEDRKAPALFYQNGYLQGFEDIRDQMPQVMESGEARGWQDIAYRPGSTEKGFNLGDWGVLLLTGLANGLNPCGLSMLLLVISMLMAKKEKIWKLGAAFISAKLLTYLLLGTLFSSVAGQLAALLGGPVMKILKWGLAAVFFFLAVVNFADLILAKQEKYGKMKLQLPAGVKEFNKRYLERALEKGSRSMTGILFLAGIVVSAGEFLCTGQLYLASILYVMERQSTFDWSVFIKFAAYLICMCIPLILITAAADRGARLFSISEQVRRKIPLMKLIYTGLFIVFGILMLVI